MSEDASFADLIRQVRAGDEASAELVRRYEPAIRRSARLRLGQKLRRAVDSLDLTQAVLGSFFVRVAAGQYELGTPEELLELLATMIRNKVSKLARHEQAERRDQRRVEVGAPEDLAFAQQASPSRQVSGKEMLEQVLRRLSDEERQLLEIAAELRMAWRSEPAPASATLVTANVAGTVRSSDTSNPRRLCLPRRMPAEPPRTLVADARIAFRIDRMTYLREW